MGKGLRAVSVNISIRQIEIHGSVSVGVARGDNRAQRAKSGEKAEPLGRIVLIWCMGEQAPPGKGGGETW